MLENWHRHVLVASGSLTLIGLGVAGVFALLSVALHKSERPGESIAAAPAGEVKGKPLVDVAAPPKLKAYKPEVKEKLNLPPEVVADKNEQVIATARVPDTLRPHTVTTTIDTSTGEAQSFVRPDPYPWFKLESRGELALGYGYKYSTARHGVAPIGRLEVRQDFLQLKALHVGVVGTFDTDRDAYVGVRVAYRW